MANRRAKISIVGSGQIGGMASLLIAQKELGDVTLFDIVPNMPAGKALDQYQMCAIQKCDACITGTNEYSSLAGSDVVIVIAGVPRKPGMSRDDLVGINTKIIRDVGSQIKTNCPNAFVICVTNPLDVMVQVLFDELKFPKNKVVGMAGILDSARFKMFLSEKLKVSITDVSAIVLGGHGDSMVPLTRMTSVGGIPLDDLIATGAITKEEVDAIVVRTRNGGAEVLNLLGSGSAYNAPAAAVVEMTEAYLKDKKRLIPCTAYLTGEYGINGNFIGVPVIIGAGGVEKIIELKLKNDERELFDKSAKAVIELQKKVPAPTCA